MITANFAKENLFVQDENKKPINLIICEKGIGTIIVDIFFTYNFAENRDKSFATLKNSTTILHFLFLISDRPQIVFPFNFVIFSLYSIPIICFQKCFTYNLYN